MSIVLQPQTINSCQYKNKKWLHVLMFESYKYTLGTY